MSELGQGSTWQNPGSHCQESNTLVSVPLRHCVFVDVLIVAIGDLANKCLYHSLGLI